MENKEIIKILRDSFNVSGKKLKQARLEAADRLERLEKDYQEEWDKEICLKCGVK